MSGAYCVKGRACTNALGNDLAAIEEGKKIAMQSFKTLYLSIFLCLIGFITDRTGATNLAMWKKWCEEDGTINNKKGKQTAKRESVSNSDVTSNFNRSSHRKTKYLLHLKSICEINLQYTVMSNNCKIWYH